MAATVLDTQVPPPTNAAEEEASLGAKKAPRTTKKSAILNALPGTTTTTPQPQHVPTDTSEPPASRKRKIVDEDNSNSNNGHTEDSHQTTTTAPHPTNGNMQVYFSINVHAKGPLAPMAVSLNENEDKAKLLLDKLNHEKKGKGFREHGYTFETLDTSSPSLVFVVGGVIYTHKPLYGRSLNAKKQRGDQVFYLFYSKDIYADFPITAVVLAVATSEHEATLMIDEKAAEFGSKPYAESEYTLTRMSLKKAAAVMLSNGEPPGAVVTEDKILYE